MEVSIAGHELVLRPLGPGDEAFVFETAGMLPGPRATALIARCLVDGERIAPRLTVGHREALLLHLRRLTIGDDADAVLQCPSETCRERMEIPLRVSDLLVPPYEDAGTIGTAAVVADGAQYNVRFELPTASDVDAVAMIARVDPQRAADDLLRRCVTAASCDGAAIDAGALPDAARDAVSESMAAGDPQAELELDLTCPWCGMSFSALFDAATFLLCELDQRAAALVSDVHTLALHYHWSEADILALPPRRRERYLELVASSVSRARMR